MNLYCTLPFGRLNHRTIEIIDLANALGRTPSSVSMKLCNLASFDPLHKARGVKGLTGASKADQRVWEEFHADWEALAVESEELRQVVAAASTDALNPTRQRTGERPAITMPMAAPTGPDEGERTARVRYSQSFFRRSVLAAYGVQCCITGNPVPQLLVASHILPWKCFPEHRANPQNGLCLSRIHDAAFDQGLITLDEDYRLVLSRYLKDFLPNDVIAREFSAYEGGHIRLPDKFPPQVDFLTLHHAEVFVG